MDNKDALASLFGDSTSFEVNLDSMVEVPEPTVEPDLLDDLNPEVEPEVEGKEEVTLKEEKTGEDPLDTLFGGSSKPQEEVVGEFEEEVISEGGVNLSDLAQTLISEGVWEAFDTLETEEGEIPLEGHNLTLEQFKEIQRQQIEIKSSQAISGHSDLTRELIEIEKAGGDVGLAIANYRQYEHPLDNLDLSTIEGQRSAIFIAQSLKLDKEEVLANIKDYEKAGTLEARAITSAETLKKALKTQREKLAEQGRERAAKEAEILAKYKKDITAELKSQFQLSPKYIKNLVTNSTEKGDAGFGMDLKYQELRKDPKKAAMLALFLNDPDEYNKQISGRVKEQLTKKEFAKMRITTKGGGRSNNIQKPKTRKGRGTVSLDSLV